MRKSILLCILMWLMSCSQHYEEGTHPPPNRRLFRLQQIKSDHRRQTPWFRGRFDWPMG